MLDAGTWPAWVRRIGWLAVAAALAGVVVAVVARQHPDVPPRHRPVATKHVVAAATVWPLAVPRRHGAFDDVLTTGSATFVLDRDTVLRSNGTNWLHRPTTRDEGGQRRLLLDTDTPTLWVVDLHATGPSAIEAFDSTTLRPLHDYRWPRDVAAAVPVRGSLYVADATGLHRLTTDGATTPIAVSWSRRILALAADPRHDRTLAVIGPRRRPRLGVIGDIVRFRTTPLPPGVVDPTLGVTAGGQIWLGGRGRSGAVLDHLDPETLRSTARSPLAARLGPVAVIHAGGTGSLLVSGAAGQPPLWCMDGSTGDPTLRWRIAAGRAAMTSGAAVAIAGGTISNLELGGYCLG